MGQKVNPISIRLGINKSWDSKWYPSDKKNFAKWLVEDNTIREFFRKVERKYSIGRLIIERTNDDKIVINIHTSRPGVILGKEGKNLQDVNLKIHKEIRDRKRNIEINIIEIKNPDLNAQLIANEIAVALENRVPFRIIQKKMIARVMRAGAKGVKTKVSGRLNGVEMARSEGYLRGVVPLQTFRSDIDYHHAEAHTTYGVLGVKVWISNDEILRNSKPNFNKDRPRGRYQPRNNYNNNRTTSRREVSK